MDKHQGPAPMVILLGTMVDLTLVAEQDEIRLRTKEERGRFLLDSLRKARHTGRSTPMETGVLVGKLMHVAEAMPGRVGRGQLAALSEHDAGNVSKLSDEAATAICYHVCLPKSLSYRTVPLNPEAYPTSTVTSDAS